MLLAVDVAGNDGDGTDVGQRAADGKVDAGGVLGQPCHGDGRLVYRNCQLCVQVVAALRPTFHDRVLLQHTQS